VRSLDLKSGQEKILTKKPGKYVSPKFSPDGKQVAYEKTRGGYLTTPWHGMETGVYLVNTDGKSEPALITEDGSNPQFAKDNQNVYVTRTQYSGEVDWSTSLVRITLKNGEERSIAKGDFVSDFAISPNGDWLSFTERFHTFVTPLPQAPKAIAVSSRMDGLPVKQLDVNAGEYLHWSGDSSKLHFSLGDQLFTSELKNAFSFLPGAPKEIAKPVETGLAIGFKETADKPTGVTVISGAKIVTMKGDEVLENGRIVVQDNRIVAIGKVDDVAIPSGAKLVDAKGKTIIPGIVDVHWHGGMAEGEIIPQQSWIDYASLAFGVTTIHDPSNDTSEIFTHSEMQKAGKLVAPRIFSTGTIYTVPKRI